MESAKIRNRLAFSLIKNINIGLARTLGEHGITEDNIANASAAQLSALTCIPVKAAAGLGLDKVIDKAAQEHVFVCANSIQPVWYKDSVYPTRMLNFDDAPVLLYKLGDADLNARHVISIVGTRHATPYGIEATNRIVRELSERLDDLVIVSGLAYGIDVAAHKAALDCGVPTVAVSAVPLNTVYPADHRGVAVRIVREGGAIITEYPTLSDVHKSNFLERNRIIAAMADATIVVESDAKGGSLATARMASDYNREVFAVPGRLSDRYSKGTLRLIATERARIFTDAEDMIEFMGWQSVAQPGEQMSLELELTEDEQKVYDYLMAHPASRVNEIMLGTSLPTGKLKDLLFTMELRELVMAVAGNRYTAI